MAVTLNAKGSTFPSFTIGKRGVTLYQGTASPDNAVGNSGDLYFYANGSASSIFQKQSTTWQILASGGNVTGPLLSTNNALARFNGTTGELIANSGITIDNNNTLAINKTNSIINSKYIIYNTTTDNTPTQLYLDGSSSQIVLQNNTVVNFKIQLAARKVGAVGTNFISSYNGAIARDGSAATTALIGDITQDQVINPNNLDWNVDISADTTNGALKIEVTGDAATNILWGASIETIELTA